MMKMLVLSWIFLLVACASNQKPRPLYDSKKASYQGLGIIDDSVLDEDPPVKIIGAEVEDKIQEQDLSEVAYEDIPYVLNEQVQKWLDYFQGRGKKHMAVWLSRSGRYVPMMKEILKENGLPEDLVYLSMIESGFSSYAYSRARAVGQWQFIYHTGKRYGLQVNWWIDERPDPEKSTIAAAQYLKFLFDEFQHWYLAAAGYNAGENKISRAISRYKTDDYWEISKYPYIKPETKNYVPKLIAAAKIAKDPAAHGFHNIEYQQPLAYEKVLVPESVELKTVAHALDLPIKELKALNPELLRAITPPKYPNYELKIPTGYKGTFLATYETMPKYQIKDIFEHRIRKGESLSVIARNYGVSSHDLALFNQLGSVHRIRAGQVLKIPVSDKTTASSKPQTTQKGTYLVQEGDSYWSISRKLNVTVNQLKQMNPTTQAHQLKPGQKLNVHRQVNTATGDDQWTTYRVQSGDSLWKIARKLGLSMEDLARWNQLNPKTAVLHPGKKLKIKAVY